MVPAELFIVQSLYSVLDHYSCCLSEEELYRSGRRPAIAFGHVDQGMV